MKTLPKLFSFGLPLRQVGLFTPSFVTPRGIFDLSLTVNGEGMVPRSAFAAGDRFVLTWPTIDVELLLVRPVLNLPPGMIVSDARAAVFRMRSANLSRSLILRCLMTVTAGSNTGRESGENLDAQSWSDGSTKVTVGLPDYGVATSYRDDGFEVLVDSRTQAHFVCAWGPDVYDDISTWFAVDCTPAQLVAKRGT